MNPAPLPSSPSDSGFPGRWLHRLAWVAGSLLLWDCQPYPYESPCYRNPDPACYDGPYSDPYDNGPQSGTPADLPKGEREFALVLDPDLQMWFDVYDAVPRRIFIGNGPDVFWRTIQSDVAQTRVLLDVAVGGGASALELV